MTSTIGSSTSETKTSPFWYSCLPEDKPVQIHDLTTKFTTQDLSVQHRVKALVIGCGMTGASVAFHLAKSSVLNPSEDILVVEARGLCDGATGRNGGHQLAEVAEPGDEIGQKHMRIEQADVEAVGKFISSLEDSSVRDAIELHHPGSVHFSMDPKEAPFLQDFANKTQQTFLDNQGVRTEGVVSPQCNEEHLSGVIIPGAGQMVPGRLVLALVDQARKLGVRVETSCKVTSIEKVMVDEKQLWSVSLSSAENGLIKILTETVVHASNAYGLELLPDRLQKYCKGVRGQCIAAQVSGGRGPVVAPRTLTFESCEGSHEEYLIQRVRDNVIIFGGCRHAATNEGEKYSDEGEPEDQVKDALVQALTKIYPDSTFEILNTWTGLMCFTEDRRPLVGHLVERKGQYAAIGFGGHGMVRTFSVGRAIASLVSTNFADFHLSEDDQVILDLFSLERVAH
mmetsp:Transcript_4961/g.10312  ORF Transcript_4961/g.10312 Transcript_4961/m.10312 type:complete len:454 (-) Transcript_4961:142-1503(-)